MTLKKYATGQLGQVEENGEPAPEDGREERPEAAEPEQDAPQPA